MNSNLESRSHNHFGRFAPQNHQSRNYGKELAASRFLPCRGAFLSKCFWFNFLKKRVSNKLIGKARFVKVLLGKLYEDVRVSVCCQITKENQQETCCDLNFRFSHLNILVEHQTGSEPVMNRIGPDWRKWFYEPNRTINLVAVWFGSYQCTPLPPIDLLFSVKLQIGGQPELYLFPWPKFWYTSTRFYAS